MTNILTAQDVADFAPDLDTSQFSVTTLSGIISQAQQRAASFCNVPGFEFQSQTETDRALISNRGELVISVRRRPIVNVTSITLKRGQFSTSLTLSDANGPFYNIPYPGNRVHLPNAYLYATGSLLAGASSQLLSLKAADMFCTVVYDGGYQTIPFDLKDALLLWVQDILVRRINRAGVQSFSQGSLSMNFGAGAANDRGDSRLIQQAKDALMKGGFVRAELM